MKYNKGSYFERLRLPGDEVCEGDLFFSLGERDFESRGLADLNKKRIVYFLALKEFN